VICHALSAVVQRTVKTCSRIAHQKTLGIGCHENIHSKGSTEPEELVTCSRW
jgi:hypothetical protein